MKYKFITLNKFPVLYLLYLSRNNKVPYLDMKLRVSQFYEVCTLITYGLI